MMTGTSGKVLIRSDLIGFDCALHRLQNKQK